MKHFAQHIFLYFILLIFLTGCGVLVTSSAKWLVKDDPKKTELTPVIGKDTLSRQVANDFGLMAWFALVAYRDDLRGDRKKTPCELEKNEELLNMPYSENGTWMRWASDKTGVVPCYFGKNGLFYETYVFKNKGGDVEKAVIAYRGTENTDSQFLKDWSTNLAAAFGWQPPQYKSARKRLKLLVESLKSDPDVQIYAVGHSLGGGLAQQAGYLSRKIEEIYTFNSSPVTNWSRLKWGGLVDKKYPIVHRVFHTGEILEITRIFTSSVTGSRYGRSDLGLQFKKKSLIKGHSMRILACTFAQIISDTDDVGSVAKYEYTKKYIDHHVLGPKSKKTQLCKAYDVADLERKER